MAQILEIVENNLEVLTRRRFVKSLVGVSAASVAWAAGVRDAFACGTFGTNYWLCSDPQGNSCGNCRNCPNCPTCGSLNRVACCCLANPVQCPGGTCCSCNFWAWYCTDCSLHDYECIECNDPSCKCSTANYLGHAPAA
jgi:hypothetical protein